MIEMSNIIDENKQGIATKYCVFEIETTGLDVNKDKIIEIGAVKLKNGEIVDTFSEYVNPKNHILESVSNIVGIDDKMVRNCDTIEKVLPKFIDFIGNSAFLVSHGEEYDYKFLLYNCMELGLRCKSKYIDSLMVARRNFPEFKFYSLDKLAKRFDIPLEKNNRAVDNAKVLAIVFQKMLEKIGE